MIFCPPISVSEVSFFFTVPRVLPREVFHSTVSPCLKSGAIASPSVVGLPRRQDTLGVSDLDVISLTKLLRGGRPPGGPGERSLQNDLLEASADRA